MAYSINSSLLAFFILLAIYEQALAMRHAPGNSKNENLKQPQFLCDHSYLIPGIGRYMAPPILKKPCFSYIGGTGGHIPGGGNAGGHIPGGDNTGSHIPGGNSPGGHIPGGDDTFVPNPGVEVPIPGSGSHPVPASAHP